jgi:hypothetical protein
VTVTYDAGEKRFWTASPAATTPTGQRGLPSRPPATAHNLKGTLRRSERWPFPSWPRMFCDKMSRWTLVLMGALVLLSGCGGAVSDSASARCDAPPSTFRLRVVFADHVEIPVHYTCEGQGSAGACTSRRVEQPTRPSPGFTPPARPRGCPVGRS